MVQCHSTSECFIAMLLYTSTFLSFQTLIGHNEDGAVIANTTSYIIDAEVTLDGSSETEHFTGFCYAGQLCSTAFGYSETAGKVFAINALFPKTLDTSYVGMYLIQRVCLYFVTVVQDTFS